MHAIVLVSKLHKPTLRALAFAKATRPNVLEGVYVSTSPEETSRLLEEWDQRRIDVPLKVLHSPYRELIRPIVEYATEIKQANPRGVVAVYIPEYVVGRWWEQLLHNQTALRLKGRLLFTPGRDGDLGALPAALVRDRPRAGAARGVPRPPRRPAPRRRGRARQRPEARAAEPRAPARAPASRGAGPGWGSGTTPSWARSRTAVTAWSGCPRPRARVGWSSCGTRCPASGSSSRSPRAPTATGSGAPTRSRCSSPRRTGSTPPCPYAGPGALRRLRLPARRRSRGSGCSRPTWSASSCPGWPGWTLDVTVEAVPGRRGRAALADPAAVRRRCPAAARDAQAPLPRRRPGRRLPDRRRRRPDHAVHGVGVRGRRGDGFWQVHPGAPEVLVDTVLELLAPRPGESVLDLYAGVGLFARFLADAVGPTGRSPWSRATARACEHAEANVPGADGPPRRRRRGARAGSRWRRSTWSCSTRRARVPAVPSSRRSPPGRRARSPTSPATRPPWPGTSRSSPSTATCCERLRAFDLFPMTHHVECVALLDFLSQCQEPSRSAGSTT